MGRITHDGGVIDFKRYNIGNGEIKRFIFQRCYEAEKMYREAANKLTDKTLNKMLEHMKQEKNMEHLKNSEIGDLLIERVKYQSKLLN